MAWKHFAHLSGLLALGLAAASGQEAPDEGTLSGLAVRPSLFSPGSSPGKLDKAKVEFTLTREMPVFLHVLRNGQTVRTVPAPAVASHVGQSMDRYEWDGRDDAGKVVEDGDYLVKAFTTVEFNWRHGDPRENPSGASREPGAIPDPTGFVKVADGRYLAVDSTTFRCTEFASNGTAVGSWPVKDLFKYDMPGGPVYIAGGPVSLAADPSRGHVYLLSGERIAVWDLAGKLVRRVRLQALLLVGGSGAPAGLYVHPDGRIVGTDGEVLQAHPSFPDAGKIRVFDAAGKLLQTVGTDDGTFFFGPICTVDGKNPDRIVVQRMPRGDGGRDHIYPISFAVIEIPSGKDPTAHKAFPLRAERRLHLFPKGPIACAGDRFFKGSSRVDCFDAEGQHLWSLGSMDDKRLQPAALLADGDNVICISKTTGHVESWNFRKWRELGQASVEADSTPPKAELAGTDGLVTAGNANLALRGTVADKNFSKYAVTYRQVTGAGSRPRSWIEVRGTDTSRSVTDGVLAEWRVATALRDKGIEVRLVAWDIAGNSSESTANLAFDDDGDGKSNAEEIALGTDPRNDGTTTTVTKPPPTTTTEPAIVTTYIHEFAHPPVATHFHPTALQLIRPLITHELSLSQVTTALSQKVHSMELDLHQHGGIVYCYHDSRESWTPPLTRVLDALVAHKGANMSVQGDGRQFFLVLEPKDDDAVLYEGIYRALELLRPHLSTAARPGDAARGITAVITGKGGKLYDHMKGKVGVAAVNELCIIEDHDYAPDAAKPPPDRSEIVNLAGHKHAFQWYSYAHPNELGEINSRHKGGFNVRAYFGTGDPRHGFSELVLALGAGADEVNCDWWEVQDFQNLLASRTPRGLWPSLAIRDNTALLAWQTADLVGGLSVAKGTANDAGLTFRREVLLTCLLSQRPTSLGTGAALAADGRLVLAHQSDPLRNLWCTAGKLDGDYRFVTFDGSSKRLRTTAGGVLPRGKAPAVAVAPDGRLVIAYETSTLANAHGDLWLVTGRLSAESEIVDSREVSLTQGDARRGYTPSVAFAPDGRFVVVYQGTGEAKIWYVTARLADDGSIAESAEFRLGTGNVGKGFTPSIAFDPEGRCLVVYRSSGLVSADLWYFAGRLNAEGRIEGAQHKLTSGGARRGWHPTVGFYAPGKAVILYQGSSLVDFWYSWGRLQDDWSLADISERKLELKLGD